MSTNVETKKKTVRLRSIKAAMKSPAIRRALGGLVGCPVGGWAETAQARRRLIDELPLRAERSYSADDLIEAALTVDHAGRYQWRTEVAS